MFPKLEGYLKITLENQRQALKLVGYKNYFVGRLVGYRYDIENGKRVTYIQNTQEDFYKVAREAMEREDSYEWLARKLEDILDEETVSRLENTIPNPIDSLTELLIDGEVRGGGQTEYPESFNEYPQPIQDAANKIVSKAENGEIDLFEWFIGVLDKIHVGDRKEKALCLLSIGTLFVENADPVHQAIRGRSGTGKTHMAKSVCKIVPERFVHVIQSSSPLYLFYANGAEDFECEKSRDDYNIYVFDDVPLNESIIDVAKVLTDNEHKEKVHRTVADQRAHEYRIPGKGLVFFTRARDMGDEELNNRLLYNNPQEDSKHKKELLEFVRRRKARGKSKKLEMILSLARAAFEKLIEYPIKVVNPWFEFLAIEDYEDVAPRELERLYDIAKAITFFRRFQRKMIYRNDLILGAKEDLLDALRIWGAVDLLEKFKIDKSQIRLISLLEPYSQETLNAWRESYEDDPEDFKENPHAPTYKNLARKLSVARRTVRDWIHGAGRRTQPSLIDRGIVEVFPANPDAQTSPRLVFLSEKFAKHLESSEDDTVLFSFRFEKREWTDKEKEEAIRQVVETADDRIREEEINKMIEEVKGTDEWSAVEDDETLYQLLKAAEDSYKSARTRIVGTEDEYSLLEVDEVLESLERRIGEEIEDDEEEEDAMREEPETREDVIFWAAPGGDGTDEKESVESRVYNYIKHHNERYKDVEDYLGCHLKKIEEDLRIDQKELINALDKLQKEGKVENYLEFVWVKGTKIKGGVRKWRL